VMAPGSNNGIGLPLGRGRARLERAN
jgi:hypothetical protein